MFALYTAIVIVYLILAAQFESFIHPFTIMMSLPLALIGVFLALFICNENLSIFALIGIIMLVGIVTRNGILLVEFANQIRADDGVDAHHAMLKAGPLRLRPILMTAATTMIGIVPVALGLSEGGETRSAMGVAVIGGMATSTFLTLFIVPTAYITFDGIMTRFKKLMNRMGLNIGSSSSPGNSGNANGPGPDSSSPAPAKPSSNAGKGKVKLDKDNQADGRSLEEIRRGKVLIDSDDKETR